MSGHFYEPEVLLHERECDAGHKSGSHTDQGYKPSFKYEYPSDEVVLCTEAPECLYVGFLLNYEHGEASEYVECDYYDDKQQNHVDCRLLILHHLVQ